MELLTKLLRSQIPPLYSQEGLPDPIVYAKFFGPDSGWTWFATEGGLVDGEYLFFGYVVGLEEEWGYFSLAELQSFRGLLGLPVERDLYFHPSQVSEVLRKLHSPALPSTP